MALKETEVRDQLKYRLDLIEPGLQLVDDEFYLRNRIGTGGFVDILAKDSAGRLVVIELKVSKHSERDAITELFKYLALLKVNTAIKDSEIRLLVISTDWRELRVPFAEFHWNTAYNSTGLLLETDPNGHPLSLRPV
jgi:RecB family endonuclease NucS